MIVSLIRHGSTLWNEEGRMQGRHDVPLSPQGRREVAGWQLPAAIERDASWVSSPLRRAAETAAILRGAPTPAEPALAEMSWGEWEGSTLDDLRALPGREFDRNEALGLDFRPPGGESPRDVLERLEPWLRAVGAGPVPVVAVTHLGVIRAVLAAATGWDMTGKPPVRLRRATLHRFAVDASGRLSIVACNLSLAPDPSDDPP
jgi:broad specificity phosphatase PhoE